MGVTRKNIEENEAAEAKTLLISLFMIFVIFVDWTWVLQASIVHDFCYIDRSPIPILDWTW